MTFHRLWGGSRSGHGKCYGLTPFQMGEKERSGKAAACRSSALTLLQNSETLLPKTVKRGSLYHDDELDSHN